MWARLTLFLVFWSKVSSASSLPLCSDFPNLPRDSCVKPWSTLVFMAADNNLFPYALWNIDEMEAANASDNHDVVVQLNGPGLDDSRRFKVVPNAVDHPKKTYFDFEHAGMETISSPALFKVTENIGKNPAQDLREFLDWSIKNFPAEHYFVIVWGHGQGWKARLKLEAPKASFFEQAHFISSFDFPLNGNWQTKKILAEFGGIAFSKTSGQWIDIPSLREVLDFHTENKQNFIDVYASDACLMQMLEVAYEISDTAQFVVGSTQIQSYEGYPYRKIINFLNLNANNEDVSRQLAFHFPEFVKQESEGDAAKFFTVSAISSSELHFQLIPRIEALGNALVRYLKENPIRNLDMRMVLRNVPAFEGGSQDFGVFLSYLELLLKKEQEKTGSYSAAAENLFAEISNTHHALNLTITAYGYGSAYGIDAYSRITGYLPKAVSVWLPVDQDLYYERRKDFKTSRFYQETNWGNWLDELYCPKSASILNPCRN